ncbi:MAG: ABC transporter substrate-binding protein [Desulfamplus sp.]|nr:ABC transporter substrate-binding protein [Desulfamplus sp.]
MQEVSECDCRRNFKQKKLQGDRNCSFRVLAIQEIEVGKLPVIRIGHLRILDHLLLGLAGDASNAPMLNISGKLSLSLSDEQTLQQTDCPIDAVPMGSWNQIRQSFCDGDLHGAFLPVPEAIRLFSSGMDIKILLYDGRPGAAVVGSKAASVDKIFDLKGKTVLISSYYSVHHLLFYRLMASAGLKPGLENDTDADVYIEIVPPFIVPEMLHHDESCDIGGCFIEEPFGSLSIGSGWGRKLCSSSGLWPDHPSSVLVMHDYVIRDFSSHVMDIIRLLVAANRLVYRGSDELYRLSLVHFFSEKRQVVEQILSSSLPVRPVALMPDVQSLEIINRFMVKNMGIMKNIINIADLVDTSFALETGA